MFLKQSSFTETFTGLRTEDPYGTRHFGKSEVKKGSLMFCLPHCTEEKCSICINGSSRTEIHDVALSFAFIIKQ